MTWSKVAGGVALVLAAVVAAVAYFLPAAVERRLNGVVAEPPYAVSAADRALYDSLPFVADLHSDALLWARDLNERVARGHVDVPRLIEAGVGLQAFTIVTKTPKGQNYRANDATTDNVTALMVAQRRARATWSSLLARALDMCARLEASAAVNDDFRIIRTGAGLRGYVAARRYDRGQTAGLLGVEGLHALEGDLANLARLFDAGVRMVAPVHFFDNAVGGSAHGREKGGLTTFGAAVVAEAERRGMLIDLSHGSDALIADVLDVATRPVIVSHTGVRATCPGGRNLSDDQLRRIAADGGLVGIALFAQAVCGPDAAATARAIRHAADVMGVEHVALGSDFDGAVTTPFDVTGLPLLVPALRAEGFDADDIAAILGGNTRDFLLANLPAR